MAEELNIDTHKLIYHPDKVAEWLKKGDCYPIYVEAGITNSCNHRCIFCCYDYFVNKNHLSIDKDVMLKALKDMGEKGVKSIMFAGDGEPFLHKDVCLFVQKAKEYGLDVSITSNGTFFTPDIMEKCLPCLTWIRFSIDSGSPENYAKIHGTSQESFERLMNNLEEAVKFKKKHNLKVTIGTQFLLIPQNVHEVIKLAEKLKAIGVDNLQIKPYSQNPNSINRFVINYKDYAFLGEELKKLESLDFKIFFRSDTMKRVEEGNIYPECLGLCYFTLIDARGDVLPCSLFYGKPNFTYGNLYKQSFSEIWESETRKKIMQEINKDISHCRHGCRLDPINRYLNRLKNPGAHDNFI
jgi:radical SAM protein with 4Fe4S-binding SPASM domain